MLVNVAKLLRCGSAGKGSTRAFSKIPVVDIEALVTNNGCERTREIVGKQLHDACMNVGFFYIANHGVSEHISASARNEARTWFLEKNTEVERIALSPESHYRGYQTLGANVTRYSGGFQRDWHEALDLYYELDPHAHKEHGIRASELHGRNLWPSSHPRFREAVMAHITAMRSLGDAVMRGIALGLGLAPDYFALQNQGAPYWCSRVIHYPTLPSVSSRDQGATAELALAGAELSRGEQLSCGEHTDYGMLTIVNQDPGVAALQVKNADGVWVTAAPIAGTFVCNVGDMMRVWTNGLYMPTLHRVVNASRERSRVSIPYFHEPGFDTVVRPVLGLLGSSRPPRVASRHYGSHLESKVFRNFEL